MSFDSPTSLAIVASIIAAATALWVVRLPVIPRSCAGCLIFAGVCLALAAGEPVWKVRHHADVVVMVDCSASTRTASYRERAALAARVEALLPHDARVRYDFFSDTNRDDAPPAGATLADLPSDHTAFTPPPADAVLLFSDGRFDLPVTSPPVFAVIDPKLDDVDDGAVTSLELRDDNRGVAVTARSLGATTRSLTIAGEREPVAHLLPQGSTVTEARIDPAPARVVARVQSESPDAWPEDDELSIVPAPIEGRQQWIVGPSIETTDAWRTFARAADLPTDPAEYVRPSVIVMHNVPADDVTRETADRLTQYVRDLGGTLVIVGGDRAFAAGGYIGSPLDALSPLASAPPEPTTHWILLVDASGSMAGAAERDGHRTRLEVATDAVAALIPTLPPRDVLSVASFSRDLHWWSTAQAVADARPPLIGETAQGPTNLQAALDQVASNTTARELNLRTELLIVTDADTKIDAPRQLAQRFAGAHVRVHVLATSPAAPSQDNPVRLLAAETGGTLLSEADATGWSRQLVRLARAASGDAIEHGALTLQFDESLHLAPRQINAWNRTWPKRDAQTFANDTNGAAAVLAAQQHLGLGRTIALAFEPTRPELAAIVDRWQSAPADPRLTVTWELGGPTLRVRVDATDPAAERYINELKCSLQLHGSTSGLRQTSPGRYELEIPAPRQPAIAAVVLKEESGPRLIARRALAGRYAPEFDAIGNDRDALRKLARRSGGRIIERTETGRIDLGAMVLIRRRILTSWFSTCAALTLAMALIVWKRAN